MKQKPLIILKDVINGKSRSNSVSLPFVQKVLKTLASGSPITSATAFYILVVQPDDPNYDTLKEVYEKS